MKYSLIIVTDNSEAYIQDLLWTLKEQITDEFQVIIVDNLSEDETVPIIVGVMNYDFCEEDQYKFYIASKKTDKKGLIKIGLKASEYEPIIVNVKGRLRKHYLEERIRGNKK